MDTECFTPSRALPERWARLSPLLISPNGVPSSPHSPCAPSRERTLPPKAAGTAAAYPALVRSRPPADQCVQSSPASRGLVLIYPLFLEGTLRLSCLKSPLGNCLNSGPALLPSQRFTPWPRVSTGPCFLALTCARFQVGRGRAAPRPRPGGIPAAL